MAEPGGSNAPDDVASPVPGGIGFIAAEDLQFFLQLWLLQERSVERNNYFEVDRKEGKEWFIFLLSRCWLEEIIFCR